MQLDVGDLCTVLHLMAPLCALLAWGLWPVADVATILAQRFRDGRGRVVRP